MNSISVKLMDSSFSLDLQKYNMPSSDWCDPVANVYQKHMSGMIKDIDKMEKDKLYAIESQFKNINNLNITKYEGVRWN